MPVLTGIELAAHADFVFASDELADIQVAAWLVQQATDPRTLDGQGLPPERLLSSGRGRLAARFDDLAAARDWTGRYTRWLHRHAPGLEAVVAHRVADDVDPASGLDDLRLALAAARCARSPDVPLDGLGVAAACVQTGWPATDLRDDEPISPLVRTLREPRHREQALARWGAFLPARMGPFAHAKGSAAGRPALPLRREDLSGDPRRARPLGLVRLRGPGVNAELLRALVERFDDGTRETLPLSPIILDGDELVLACEGRIARDLAAAAPPGVRAGLAVFPAHLPWRRAYALAAIPELGTAG